MKMTYGFTHEEDEILSCESLGITTRAKEIIDDILYDADPFDSTVSTIQRGVNGKNKNGYGYGNENMNENENGGFRMKNGLGITQSSEPVKNVVGLSL